MACIQSDPEPNNFGSYKEAKIDFEKKLAKNIKKDSKSFYAYYREKNRSRVGIGPLEDADMDRQ